MVGVTSEGTELYALFDDRPDTDYRPSLRWARSTDGGHTWQRSPEPTEAPPVSTGPRMRPDPGGTGQQSACTSDGTCWHLKDRRAIERVDANGDRVEEARLSDVQFGSITNHCSGHRTGLLASIAAVEIDGNPHVVASLGIEGTLVRQTDGTWERVGVLSITPSGLHLLDQLIPSPPALAFLAVGSIAALYAPLLTKRWGLAYAVAAAGWGSTVIAGLTLELVVRAPSDGLSSTTAGVSAAGLTLTLIAILLAGRRPLPPPPPPPPYTVPYP